MSEPAIPSEPTIWAAARVAACRSPAGPVPASPKNSSSATIPPMAIWMRAITSVRVLVKRSSLSEWASSPIASLDDRQHLELAAGADEMGDGCVPGLVGGDTAPLLERVLDRLLQADLLG